MAKSLRALILEDSPDDLELVVRELRLGGFDVTYENCQTAADMRAALGREPWDVILSDYSMPGFKAPNALEILHESGLDIPFIIVSGAIGDESAAMIMKAGAHDYVNKSNLSRLVPAIERELREVGTRRAQRESDVLHRSLFESATDAIFLMDDYRFTECNPATLAIYGCSARDDIVGRHPWEFSPIQQPDGRDSRAGSVEMMDAALAGRPQRFEWRHTRCDGTEFDAEVVLNRLDFGERMRLLAVVREITDRKRADAALRKSEARFRAIFEQSPVAMWEEDFSGVKARLDELRVAGVTGFRAHFDQHPEEVSGLAALVRVLAINRRSVELLGAKNAEQVPLELPCYFTAASMPAFKDELVALAEGQRRFECEIPTLDANGRPLLLDLLLVVQPGHEVDLSRVLVSFLDITERKRAEAAAEASARALARSQQVGHLGSWEWDMVRNRLTWSEEMYRLFGVGPDFALTYDGILQLVHPDDREMNNRLVGEMLATGEGVRFEFRIVRPGGETRHLLQQVEVTLDDDGKTARVFGIMLDITERKRAEAVLAESEARLRALFENSRDAISLSKDERHVLVNPSYVRTFGYASDQELIGQPTTERVAPAERARVQGFTEMRASGGDAPVFYGTRGLRKDGTEFDMELSVARYKFGGETYSLVVLRDVTERKAAERQLKTSYGLLRAAMTSMPGSFFSLDREYRYTSFNSAHAAAMKALYGADIAAGRSILEYQTVPADRATAKANLDRALAGQTFVVSDYSGEEGLSRRFFEIVHSPIIGPEGGVDGVAVFALDITARKQAEEELARQLEELRRWQSVMLDRADRNMQLKREVNQLLLRVGEPARYPSQEEAGGE